MLKTKIELGDIKKSINDIIKKEIDKEVNKAGDDKIRKLENVDKKKHRYKYYQYKKKFEPVKKILTITKRKNKHGKNL